MSSRSHFKAITSEDMSMIRAVLKGAGYDASFLSRDERQFNIAAFLVMKLFLEGETSMDALSAQLARHIEKAGALERSYQSKPALQATKRSPGNTTYVLKGAPV
jgi:hypothetical protein